VHLPLRNIGNTMSCFLNSTVQLLSACNVIRQKLLSHFHSHHHAGKYNCVNCSNVTAFNAYNDEFDKAKRTNGYGIDKCLSAINVESVNKSIRSLKRGKACGPDNISAEHLLYAHPSLVMHLKLLFHLMVVHSFVPHGFGKGYIIPLVKDKSGNLNSVDNYRAIMLSCNSQSL